MYKNVNNLSSEFNSKLPSRIVYSNTNTNSNSNNCNEISDLP